MAPYTFLNSPNQENFYVRVFAYTPDGQFGKPLCSSSISAKSLTTARQKPLTLSLKSSELVANSSDLFLQWVYGNNDAPECDQMLQISSQENTKTRHLTLVNFIHTNIPYF
jgi:hypothetical protein